MKTYVDYVYEIVKNETKGLDAVYRDAIIHLVGLYGFNALYEARLLEGCGSVNLRELYVLVDRKDVSPDKN